MYKDIIQSGSYKGLACYELQICLFEGIWSSEFSFFPPIFFHTNTDKHDRQQSFDGINHNVGGLLHSFGSVFLTSFHVGVQYFYPMPEKNLKIIIFCFLKTFANDSSCLVLPIFSRNLCSTYILFQPKYTYVLNFKKSCYCNSENP